MLPFLFLASACLSSPAKATCDIIPPTYDLNLGFDRDYGRSDVAPVLTARPETLWWVYADPDAGPWVGAPSNISRVPTLTPVFDGTFWQAYEVPRGALPGDTWTRSPGQRTYEDLQVSVGDGPAPAAEVPFEPPHLRKVHRFEEEFSQGCTPLGHTYNGFLVSFLVFRYGNYAYDVWLTNYGTREIPESAPEWSHMSVGRLVDDLRVSVAPGPSASAGTIVIRPVNRDTAEQLEPSFFDLGETDGDYPSGLNGGCLGPTGGTFAIGFLAIFTLRRRRPVSSNRE